MNGRAGQRIEKPLVHHGTRSVNFAHVSENRVLEIRLTKEPLRRCAPSTAPAALQGQSKRFSNRIDLNDSISVCPGNSETILDCVARNALSKLRTPFVLSPSLLVSFAENSACIQKPRHWLVQKKNLMRSCQI